MSVFLPESVTNTMTHTHTPVCSELQTGALVQHFLPRKTDSSHLTQKASSTVRWSFKLPPHSAILLPTHVSESVHACAHACEMRIKGQRSSLKEADGCVKVKASGILMPLRFQFKVMIFSHQSRTQPGFKLKTYYWSHKQKVISLP